ncbi:CG43320 [Drosophila busckii]|uniref:CG43320 n=1 Tax=Drosophila busckii TaxID=30019 RepID=A0A0M5J6K3_DROBS|nr:HSPB1-associated protein 1 [Drosophila busckii]ALC45506.1 CG43320 [Drosophila busckii]
MDIEESAQLKDQLRDIVLNTKVPLVLKNYSVDWECFEGSLLEWCTSFDEYNAKKTAVFESMEIMDGATPQWERKRKKTEMTMQQFLKNYSGNNAMHWSAFQYKRAFDLPDQCLKGIDFESFGFSKHDRDFSLWLGSKGANTPCHYDTYGVNIVVQVYGSKSWLLFPPETPFETTRIPYEESSVYCLENFYAPQPDKLTYYEKFQYYAHHCVLNAGDVLIVPRHWWHYVEAVETSLSVNYWVPLKEDINLALDELLVKHVVESFVKGEDERVKTYLLNPNQLDELGHTPTDLFNLFKHALDRSADINCTLWHEDYLSKADTAKLISEISLNIRALNVMSKEDYMLLLSNNSKRHVVVESKEDNAINPTLEVLINSICAPDNIARVKLEFYRRIHMQKSVN